MLVKILPIVCKYNISRYRRFESIMQSYTTDEFSGIWLLWLSGNANTGYDGDYLKREYASTIVFVIGVLPDSKVSEIFVRN